MKQVVFKMDSELFKRAKIRAVEQGKNMTQYIVELIKTDLVSNKAKREGRT